jgi:hypothetical protein
MQRILRGNDTSKSAHEAHTFGGVVASRIRYIRPEVAPAGAPQKNSQRLRDWVQEGLSLAGARLRGIARCERFTENFIFVDQI